MFVLGLPSALSYSAANWAVFGVPVLDWMDETVGTLALPVTAFLIAAVFTWFQEREAVRAQLGDSVLLSLLKYAIPTVLFAVTAIRLVARFDFPGWHALPGVEFVGSLPQSAVTLVALATLYVVGRYLARYRRRRRSSRSSR